MAFSHLLDYDGSGVVDFKDLEKKLEKERVLPKGVQNQQLRSLEWRQSEPLPSGGGAAFDTNKAMGTTEQRVKTMGKQLLKFLHSHAGVMPHAASHGLLPRLRLHVRIKSLATAWRVLSPRVLQARWSLSSAAGISILTVS